MITWLYFKIVWNERCSFDLKMFSIEIFMYVYNNVYLVVCTPLPFSPSNCPHISPICPLLTSCLFKKKKFNNPLSPISVAHICKGVGPITRTWESFQWPHPQEEWFSSPRNSQLTITPQSGKGRFLWWEPQVPWVRHVTACIVQKMACHRLSLHPAALTSILPPLLRCSQSLVEGWGERVIFMFC